MLQQDVPQLGHPADHEQPGRPPRLDAPALRRPRSSPARSCWPRSTPRTGTRDRGRSRASDRRQLTRAPTREGVSDEVQLRDAARTTRSASPWPRSRWPTSSASTPCTPRTRPGTRTSGCCSPRPPHETSQIRMGPSVSGVVLREPTLIAQAAATLDELTDGRAEVVLSSGNFGLLAQYGIDWAKTKPLSRVKEARPRDPHPARRRRDHPRRRVLQLQRPVHLRPAGAGAPAGQDGRDARAEVVRGGRGVLRRLPPRAQLHPRGLRLHDRALHASAPSAPARTCRTSTSAPGWSSPSPRTRPWPRTPPAAWSASTPPRCRTSSSSATASTPTELAPIIEAIGAGDMAKGIELTTPDLAERLSVAGHARRSASRRCRPRSPRPASTT